MHVHACVLTQMSTGRVGCRGQAGQPPSLLLSGFRSLKIYTIAGCVKAGLYNDVAFPQNKKAIGKLISLFYLFSSFYINPPYARPHTLRCFQISVLGSGPRNLQQALS